MYYVKCLQHSNIQTYVYNITLLRVQSNIKFIMENLLDTLHHIRKSFEGWEDAKCLFNKLKLFQEKNLVMNEKLLETISVFSTA